MFHLFASNLAVSAIAISALVQQVNADTIEYCSSINTASTSANSSIYQSNGLCQDFCQDTYAFAVLQDENCWCSDYVPGVTVSTSDCSKPCPGYPDDLCGGSNVYGYIELQLSPKGTKGATSSSQPTSTSKAEKSTPQQVTVTTSAGPDTVFATITLFPSSQSSSDAAAASSSFASSSSSVIRASTSAAQPSTSSTSHSTTTPVAVVVTTSASKETTSLTSLTSSTWTPTPITSLETVTGQVRTVTVTPTSPPEALSTSTSIATSKKSSGISTGGAVGLTIGLVALVAIVGALLYFWFRRRRRAEVDGVTSMHITPKGGMSEIPQRTNSESSRYMLNSDGRRVTEAWEAEGEELGSRRSRLMPVDPRLDPFAPVYQRDGRASHESINTIQDNHDYSRKVLRAVNPDV